MILGRLHYTSLPLFTLPNRLRVFDDLKEIKLSRPFRLASGGKQRALGNI